MFVPKYEILFYQTNSQFIKRDISPMNKMSFMVPVTKIPYFKTFSYASAKDNVT